MRCFEYHIIRRTYSSYMQNNTHENSTAMPYKAAVFDLDGTLLDSLADLADAGNAAMKAFGFPEHPVTSYKHFVGNGVRVLLQRALPEDARNDENLERCLKIFNEEYHQHWNRKSAPYPGIPELLDWLQDQGLALAVLSNKPQAFMQEIMNHFFSAWKFDPAYGASDAFPRKPDPTGLSLVAEQLSVKPDEILFLGDTNVDMNTANNAGAVAVGVLWGFRDAQELTEAGAKLLLEDPMGLTNWLRTPQQDQTLSIPRRFSKEGCVSA